MRRYWLSAYDFTITRGSQFLGDYARAADPFRQGRRAHRVDPSDQRRRGIGSLLPSQIDETAYERGSEAGSSHWTGILTILTKPPVSTDTLRKNPLGIYIDAIDWSRDLEPAAREQRNHMLPGLAPASPRWSDTRQDLISREGATRARATTRSRR